MQLINSSHATTFYTADSTGHGLRGPWPQRPILRAMAVNVWTPNAGALWITLTTIQVSTGICEENHALNSLLTISWKLKPFVSNFFVWLPPFGWLGVFWHRPSSNFCCSRPEHARFELSTLRFPFFFWANGSNGQLFCWWFSLYTKSPRKSLHSLLFSMDINSPRALGLYLLVIWGGSER